MANEVQINVVLNDATGPQKDAIKASLAAWADGIPPVDVTATNPITDAWKAEVDTQIAAAGEDLTVPVTADTEGLAGQVEAAVTEAQAGAQVDVPVEVADPSEFVASVAGAVEDAQAMVSAGIEVPIAIADEGLTQSAAAAAAAAGQAAAQAGPGSFRPGYSPAPLFGGGVDPYAAARQQIAAGTPLELPVRAKNPIDDAWLAQVKSSISSVANDALSIPVHPELEEFEATLESTLAELSTTSRLDIPVDVGDAMIFREQVAELVQQVESSVKAVIGVQIDNEGALTDLQQKTVAASQASLDLVNAEQKLNEAMAGGNEDQIAKARANVSTASKEEAQASKELEAAQLAAAAAEDAAGTAAKGAAFSMESLNAAMGPLWMVMNVAQIAMMGMYATASSTSTATKDLSQQLIGLGQSGQNAAAQLTGNDDLKNLANNLTGAGSSAAEFAQAYSGSLSDAESYTQRLANAQQQAGAASASFAQELGAGTSGGKAASETTSDYLQTVAQLADKVNNGTVSIKSLSQANQDAVNHYNDLAKSAQAAQTALTDMQQAQAVTLEQLDNSGGAFDDQASAAHAFGQSLASVEYAYDQIKLANPKDTLDQVSAAFDQNMLAADQAASAITTSMQQEQQAVTQAQQSVANAYHSVETASQSVANAQHGVQQAEQAYQNALDQEATAQQNVAAARAAAAQQLINLALQQHDAAASALSANVSLYDAQKAAALLGVTPGNAQDIAGQTVTDANEAQMKAAIALIQAENQVADSQNTAKQAQDSLNTAQQEGVDNNPNVIAANKALEQAQQQVASASYAVQQAHQAVAQAEYAAQQASQALTQAQQQLTAAQNALKDATIIGTASGQQHLLMVLQLATAINNTGLPATDRYNTLIKDTAAMFGGSTDAAANYLKQLNLIPQDFKYNVTAMAQVDLSALVPLESQLHMSLNNLNGKAAGGPGSGYAVVGEHGAEIEQRPDGSSRLVGLHGPEIVDLGVGSTIMPAANANLPHFAAGGVMGVGNLLGNNFGFGLSGIGYQDSVNALTVMGMAAPPGLPAYTPQPTAGLPVGPAGSVGGSRAANEAIMQQVFATMFGWTGPEWNAAYQLEMMEAGFNNTAQNPTSTAYGMGQFLDGTWASYGIPKTSDPTLQSIAMGRYIAARYGDPLGALRHEDAVHWYAAGGPASGWVGIGDGGPEAVRLPNGSTVMPAANTATLAPAPVPTELTMEFGGNVHNGFAVLIMNLVRSGQIQLSVNGQRVKAGF